MAVMFQANVYQINDGALSSPQAFCFSPVNVKFRPIETPFSVGGVTLNGIIEENPTGLRVNGVQYKVAQTVAQLQTLANA